MLFLDYSSPKIAKISKYTPKFVCCEYWEHTDSIVSLAVKWIKYCRYVVKHYSINQSIYSGLVSTHTSIKAIQWLLSYMYLVTAGFNVRSQLHIGTFVFLDIFKLGWRHPSMQQPCICCLRFCTHPDEINTKDINLLKSIRRKQQIYLNWSLSA